MFRPVKCYKIVQKNDNQIVLFLHKAYLFLSLVTHKIISDRSVGILLRKRAG